MRAWWAWSVAARRPSAGRALGGRVASVAGVGARGVRSRVAVLAFLCGHLAHDQPAFGDGALHLLLADGLLCVLELSLRSSGGHSCFLRTGWIAGRVLGRRRARWLALTAGVIGRV